MYKLVLFDEHGTPTFRPDRERRYFVGVCASIMQTNWESIISECSTDFGINNIRPIKNRQISQSRINRIGNHLSALPITLSIISLDLANEDLQRIVTLYEKYSNQLREMHRGVGNRPINQILYTQVLVHALFMATQKEIENDSVDTTFNILIDNWSFSRADIQIAIDLNRSLIQQETNEILEIHFPNIQVEFNKFVLLDHDCSEKRFIDVITSAVSRAYISNSNERYSSYMSEIVNNSSNRKVFRQDITQITIKFLTFMMDRRRPTN